MKILFPTFFAMLIIMTNSSCHTGNDAQAIVDHSIAYYGQERFAEVDFGFQFRKWTIKAKHHEDFFSYQRSYQDTLGRHEQLYSTDTFAYSINDTMPEITPKKQKAIENSINSQVYFAMLPYRLNDPAVNKKYLGIDTIKDKKYHKVEVSFAQEDGGDDYDDIYLYWFDLEDYSMDYLAYQFHVNGGGIRFREAYEIKKENGIVFQNYINYKPEPQKPSLDNIASLYQAGKLKELSRIDLENVWVR